MELKKIISPVHMRGMGIGIEVEVSGNSVPMLLDTGATSTCIDDDLAKKYGLRVVGHAGIGGALSSMSVLLYEAHVRIPELGIEKTMHIPGIHLKGPMRGLLGRDITSALRLSWEPSKSLVVLSTE